MIDFILAGILYLTLMFVVFFCLSFVTIGITLTTAAFFKRCLQWFRPMHYALK